MTVVVNGRLSAVDLTVSLIRAYLTWVSATKLTLFPDGGDEVEIHGEMVTIPSGGIDLLNTDHTIDAAGADTGGAPGVTTRYNVYLANSLPAFGAGTVRLSTTSPSAVNGAMYLGLSGDALNWRHIGVVYTISNAGTPNFADSLLQRYVSNFYNKKPKRMYRAPNYSDGNSRTTIVIDNTTWAVIRSNDYALEYIDNGVDSVEFYAQGYHETAGEILQVGIGIASTSGVRKAGVCPNGAMGCVKEVIAPSGVQQTQVNFLAQTTHALIAVADDVRNGGGVDPAVTFIEGWVWG